MSTPSKRVWVVEADENGYLDPDELAALAVDVSTVIRMVGGVAYLAADRVEVEPGRFLTRGVVARWESFAPATRLETEPEGTEQPAPDGE